MHWKGPGSSWKIGKDQINCECIFLIQSIILFNWFSIFIRFLIIWGYDTIHNKKRIVYILCLFMSTGKQRLCSYTQTNFSLWSNFCYYWFKLQFIQYVYLLPPFLIRLFFFLVSDVKCRFRKHSKIFIFFSAAVFSLLKTNKINSSINWMSNTYAEFDIR